MKIIDSFIDTLENKFNFKIKLGEPSIEIFDDIDIIPKHKMRHFEMINQQNEDIEKVKKKKIFFCFNF